MSKVTVWYMTEEERLAYIEKHPIQPIDKETHKVLELYDDKWQWRGKKAAENRKHQVR